MVDYANMLIELSNEKNELSVPHLVKIDCDCIKYRWEVKDDGNRYCCNCGENKTNY